MSKTADSTSGEVIVTVASHMSNVPSIATEAFTLNLIELSCFVILMTGTPAEACACIADGDSAKVRRQRIASRVRGSLSLSYLNVNCSSENAIVTGPASKSKTAGEYDVSRLPRWTTWMSSDASSRLSANAPKSPIFTLPPKVWFVSALVELSAVTGTDLLFCAAAVILPSEIAVRVGGPFISDSP